MPYFIYDGGGCIDADHGVANVKCDAHRIITEQWGIHTGEVTIERTDYTEQTVTP